MGHRLPLYVSIGLLGWASIAAAADAFISIQDFLFTPKRSTINVGETVHWTNDGDFTHTSSSNSLSGSETWDSGPLGPGATYSHQFTHVGVFPYHCNFHATMRDTIVVTALVKVKTNTWGKLRKQYGGNAPAKTANRARAR